MGITETYHQLCTLCRSLFFYHLRAIFLQSDRLLLFTIQPRFAMATNLILDIVVVGRDHESILRQTSVPKDQLRMFDIAASAFSYAFSSTLYLRSPIPRDVKKFSVGARDIIPMEPETRRVVRTFVYTPGQNALQRFFVDLQEYRSSSHRHYWTFPC